MKKEIVKCGHTDCIHKCKHFGDHKPTEICSHICVNSGHKCFNVVEQRKIKLKKLEQC